jgi:hypothetical protein
MWTPHNTADVKFQTGEDIPTLKLVDDPTPGLGKYIDWFTRPAIIATGGCHHTTTLTQYVDDGQATLLSVLKKIKELHFTVTADPENIDYKEQLRKEKQWAEMIEEQVNLKGQWLVLIDDKGVSSFLVTTEYCLTSMHRSRPHTQRHCHYSFYDERGETCLHREC